VNIFSGKEALITGASGGLGQEIAIELAKAGCNLHLIGRSEKKLKGVAEHIKRSFPNIRVLCTAVDFCQLEQINEFCASMGSEFDILINCAGTFPMKNLCSSTLEDYEECFNINVRAPFLFSKRFANGMKKRSWGRVVNVGSSSSYSGSPDAGLYCASKHALLGLSRSLYQELKPHNIRVFTVSPGSIQTSMGATDTRQDFSTFLNPRDVAKYIVHILSYDSELISEEVRLNRVLVR